MSDDLPGRGINSGITGTSGAGVDDLARGYSKTDAGLDIPPKEIKFGDFSMPNYARMRPDPQNPDKLIDQFHGGFLDRPGWAETGRKGDR